MRPHRRTRVRGRHCGPDAPAVAGCVGCHGRGLSDPPLSGPHRGPVYPSHAPRPTRRGSGWANRRQHAQLQPAGRRGDTPLLSFGCSRGMAIHNEDDLAGHALEQPAQKLAEDRGGTRRLTIMKRHCSFAFMAEIMLNSKRAPVVLDHRGRALQPPSGASMCIGAHPRSVDKEDGGSLPLGLRGDRRIVLHPPSLHEDRILLPGAIEGTLGRETQPPH